MMETILYFTDKIFDIVTSISKGDCELFLDSYSSLIVAMCVYLAWYIVKIIITYKAEIKVEMLAIKIAAKKLIANILLSMAYFFARMSDSIKTQQ